MRQDLAFSQHEIIIHVITLIFFGVEATSYFSPPHVMTT